MRPTPPRGVQEYERRFRWRPCGVLQRPARCVHWREPKAWHRSAEYRERFLGLLDYRVRTGGLKICNQGVRGSNPLADTILLKDLAETIAPPSGLVERHAITTQSRLFAESRCVASSLGRKFPPWSEPERHAAHVSDPGQHCAAAKSLGRLSFGQLATGTIFSDQHAWPRRLRSHRTVPGQGHRGRRGSPIRCFSGGGWFS